MFKRGKIWWCDFTINSERIRQSTGTSDRKLAEEYEANLKAEIYRVGVLKKKPVYIWNEAVIEWSKYKSRKSRGYLTALRYLDNYLNGMRLDKIDRPLIEKIKEDKASEGVTNATVNRMLEVLRSVLRKAVDWEWLDRSPKIDMLSEPRKRIRFLTYSEAQKLALNLPDHLRGIVVLALNTGLRKANILGLKWTQIRDRTIVIEETKNGESHAVYLNESAFEVINRQRFYNESEYVFTFKGKPIKSISSKTWKAACKRSGIEDFRFHDLRHTFASWLAQSGTSLFVLQEMGGWKSPQMVGRYAHLNTDVFKEHAEKLDTISTHPTLKVVK